MCQCAFFGDFHPFSTFIILISCLIFFLDIILEQTEWITRAVRLNIFVSRAYCVLFGFPLRTWKAIWCECNKELDLLPDNSTLTANSTSIQHYCELTDMAWIELRIAEAVYLAVTLLRRNSDAPAVMYMLHCADMQCSDVCVLLIEVGNTY